MNEGTFEDTIGKLEDIHCECFFILWFDSKMVK
jgi:hypothetical protein